MGRRERTKKTDPMYWYDLVCMTFRMASLCDYLEQITNQTCQLTVSIRNSISSCMSVFMYIYIYVYTYVCI